MHMLIKCFISGAKQKTNCYLLNGLVIILALTISSIVGEQTEEFVEKQLDSVVQLRMNLFTNYDKNSHPTVNGEYSNISLSLSVNYIDVDEMQGKITLHCWVRLRWMDEKRSWNSHDYDNITQIHLRTRDVWRPEITLFNSAGEGSDYLGDTHILLFHNGSLLWVPPAIYTAYCNLNMLNWPHDRQICTFKIGSWTVANIDAEQLQLKDMLEYDQLVQSTEWEIINAKADYVRRDYYNFVEYTFEIERHANMYTAIIYTPATCIVLLTLACFWLPPQMGEKILLNSVLIVVIAAFLMYFAQLLPILAQNTPLVVIFYSASLLLLSISTIIAVSVLYLATAKHKRRVPQFLKRLLNGRLGSMLLLCSFSYEADSQTALHNGGKELDEHIYDNADNDMADPLGINPVAVPSGRALQYEWILLATAVDRICFLLYCLIFAILAVVYSV